MFKWVADSAVSVDFQKISPRFGICFTDNKVSFENYNFCKKCLEFAGDLWKVNDKIYEGIPAGEHAGLNRCQIACACHRTPLIIRSFSHVSEALANAPHFMSTFVDKMFPHKNVLIASHMSQNLALRYPSEKETCRSDVCIMYSKIKHWRPKSAWNLLRKGYHLSKPGTPWE